MADIKVTVNQQTEGNPCNQKALTIRSNPQPLYFLLSVIGLGLPLLLFLNRLLHPLPAEMSGFAGLIDIILIGLLPILAFFLLHYHRKCLHLGKDRTQCLLLRERQLKDNEARLAGILSAAPVGLLTVLNDIILQVNKHICHLSGYSEDELVGRHAGILFPSEEIYRTVCPVKSNISVPYRIDAEETRIMRKNGPIIDVLLSSSPIGGTTGYIGITYSVLDITRQKQAVEEMARLQNLLRNITDSMPTILVAVDISGYVTHWNCGTERHTGIKRKDALNKPLMESAHKLPVDMETIREAIAGTQTLWKEKMPIQKRGRTHFYDVTIYPLAVKEIVEGAVVRIDDVTQQAKLQQILVHSEKMLSVGSLAAGMSHEINNPLAAIMQNIQVIRNRMRRDLPRNISTAEECGTDMDTIAAYLEKRDMGTMIDAIMEAGHSVRDVVEKVVRFGRTSESKFACHQLDVLMDEALELAERDYHMKKTYRFREIDIIKEYQENMVEVRCEGTRIQQVFLSLLKNAAQAISAKQYGAEKPAITIRISHGNPKGSAKVEIRDNGPGMSPKTQKRIFEPFFTTLAANKGSGLGLAIAYFIISKNHGGAILVNSVPGRGSTFTVQLPIDGKAQDQEESNA